MIYVHVNLPHRNPAILKWILAARNLPAESKAAPRVHPVVVAKASPIGQYCMQGTMADSALAAPHERKIRLVTANPVHPVGSTALEHGSAMQVALMCRRQNIGGTDICAALHPSHHIDACKTTLCTCMFLHYS